MSRRYLTLPISAFLLLTLIGCGPSGPKPSTLPPIPADLPVCFDKMTEAPAAGDLSKADVLRKIAELRRSEVEKSLCGKRLIAFYETFL